MVRNSKNKKLVRGFGVIAPVLNALDKDVVLKDG